MKLLLFQLCLVFCLMMSTCCMAQEIRASKIGKEYNLVGEWQIDLRPTPDAEPYYQVFTVEGISDSGLVGTFYGSPTEDGYLNSVWPELYFAFTTRDATHAYYHSGYLKEGKLFGTTYCPGRNFIARWTGERKR